MRRLLCAAALLSAPFRPSSAQTQRLTATELGLGGAVAVARRTFTGAELGLALRPANQTRVALALAAGTAGERTAMRSQLTVQFLVTPATRRGAGVYAGLGGALSARRGSQGQGYLAVVLGLEGAPGRRRGWQNWYVEAGLGGGVRAAAGWRLRWFPRWWRGG